MEWIQNLFAGPNSLPRYNLKEVVQIVQNCIVLVYTQIPINLVHLIVYTKEWLGISDTQARVSVWTPARPFDKVVKCPTCQINHLTCLDCFFFLFEADFIQLVVLNLSHLNYIKLCLFLTSNKR